MAKSIKTACLTFDVDYTDYHTGEYLDEITQVFPLLKSTLLLFPEIKTTWFVRIDQQIEKLFGEPDFIFRKHENELGWLKENGHELGWHHHAYVKENIQWKQEINEELVCNDLFRYGEIAKKYGLDSTRMGWGFQTNKTIKSLCDLGFKIDSSAIPRPNYKWESSIKDWSTTSNQPYFPSIMDYRTYGKDSLPILEVPISTVVLPVETDTENDVIRYINHAYNSVKFSEAITRFKHESLVTISHPYELIEKKVNPGSLLPFNFPDFKGNLELLREKGISFITIKELATRYNNQ